MQKIGVPQPEQVIKASSMGIVEMLKEVNTKVMPLFSDAADHLISMHAGDVKKALCQTLALLSGHHKEEESMKTKPKIDWDTQSYKQMNIKTKEINLTPAQLYAKIDKCVEECMHNRHSTYRDNCIAKHCDIY